MPPYLQGSALEVLEGVRLMVIGMTTVIGFLITLVLCMQVSALFLGGGHRLRTHHRAPVPHPNPTPTR